MASFISGGATAIHEVAYLFVDGGYFRARYEEALGLFWEHLKNPLQYLDLQRLKSIAGFQTQKVFYFDCQDDTPKTKALFDRLWTGKGYQVRLGRWSGGKKRGQKGVDIQIAVDMLTHSFYRNISKAFLIAGDLDFEPLVKALVNIGTYVTVLYSPRSVAPALLHAADDSEPITFRGFYNLSRSQ